MKKYTLSLFLLVFLLSSCTTYKMVTTEKVSEIIDVPGTKDELYVRANQWMVRTFTNAKSVIQFQDKEAGKIMGKYLMKSINTDKSFAGLPNPYDVYSLITISVKDSATRIDIEPQGKWPFNKNQFYYSPENVQVGIKVLIIEYKEFISVKEDVWHKSESTKSNSNVPPVDLKKKTTKKVKDNKGAGLKF